MAVAAACCVPTHRIRNPQKKEPRVLQRGRRNQDGALAERVWRGGGVVCTTTAFLKRIGRRKRKRSRLDNSTDGRQGEEEEKEDIHTIHGRSHLVASTAVYSSHGQDSWRRRHCCWTRTLTDWRGHFVPSSP